MGHGLASRIFLSAAQQRLLGRGVGIFMYHKVAVAPVGTLDPFLYVSPARFERQMAALAAAGFSTTSVGSIFGAAQNPCGRVVISFDDGCLNVFENCMETLARRRFTAIQFLVSDFIGKWNQWDVAAGDVPERLMGAAQVREWLAAGHEIGSHSATHRNLKKLSVAEAREEIAGSRKKLEDLFGVAVRHFSYPFGGVNERLAALVAEAGYQTACTVDFGVNDHSTPPFWLRRISPLSGPDLLRKIVHRLGRKIKARG